LLRLNKWREPFGTLLFDCKDTIKIFNSNKNDKKMNSMEKYRIQISFDIKDETGKSVLDKGTFNTVSRSIREIPNGNELLEIYQSVLIPALSHTAEKPKFRHLFFLQIPYLDGGEQGNNNNSTTVEIPAEFRGCRSLIRTINENHHNPFSDSNVSILRGVFSASR
jgi:hypothetical protein